MADVGVGYTNGKAQLPMWLVLLVMISAPLAGVATYSSQTQSQNSYSREEIGILLAERADNVNRQIENLDQVLQRETRLLDDAIKERILATEQQSAVTFDAIQSTIDRLVDSIRENRNTMNQLRDDVAQLKAEVANLKSHIN